MFNLEKKVNGAYYIIQWGTSAKIFEEFQDCWEIDETGCLCKINLQLLYNSDSKILNQKPEILALVKNPEIKSISLSLSDFFKNNDSIDNLSQILYENSVIFLYDEYVNLKIENLKIYNLTQNIFILFDDTKKLKCIIINDISSFEYVNIGNHINKLENSLKKYFITLYFKLHTYNQYKDDAINDLIREINLVLSDNNLDPALVEFLLIERANLIQELGE